MAIPLSNLKESFIYDMIPAGVRAQDANGMVQAVVGAYQDQFSDLRSAASDMSTFWSAVNSVGFPHQVVLFTYTSDTGQSVSVELELEPDTPVSTSGLLTWACAQTGVDPTLAVSAVQTTSANRTSLTQTAQLLAATLGVEVIDPIESDTDANAYLQRVIGGYFSRLKIKGTPKSFEVAGRVVGFSDTAYIPLWGRLSSRLPIEPGNSVNLTDFSSQPEIFPSAVLPDPLYDPTVTNDGPLYSWSSPELTLDSLVSSYAPLQVNSRNPFMTVQVTGSNLPVSGSYIFSGGSDLAKAYVTPSSGVLLLAAAPGASFNGMVANITATDTSFTISCTYNLSAIKFKTSLFDLYAGMDIDSYGVKYVQPATANIDLSNNPGLYASGATPYFANSGAATAPFRCWKLGSAPAPVVTTWPSLVISPGSGSIAPRVQCLPTDVEVNLTTIKNSLHSLSRVTETVRPAIDNVRNNGVGFVISDTVTYAPYVGQTTLFTSGSSPTFDSDILSMDSDLYTMDSVGNSINSISGSLSPGSYPAGSYTGEFYWVGPTGAWMLLGQTEDIFNPGNVILSYMVNGLCVTGWYNFNTAAFSFQLLCDGGSVVALWTATSGDVIRSVPTNIAQASFQTFPEDELDVTGLLTLSDDVPFMRSISGIGTDDSNDTNIDTEYESEVTGSRWMTAVNETGAEVAVTALESDKGVIPRVIINNVGLNRSQYCVGTRQIVGWTCDQSFEILNTDTTHNCDSGGVTGTSYYHVGSLRNNLVADLNAHWDVEAHQSGLVNWLRLSDHPNSPWAITSTEYPLSSVTGTYDTTSRVWDSARGWVLNLANQYASWNMLHDMTLGGTLSVWINPGDGVLQYVPFTCDTGVVLCSSSIAVNSSDVAEVGNLAAGPGIMAASFGPLQIWVNGLQASAWIVETSGTPIMVGQVQMYPNVFNFLALSGTSIVDSDTPTAEAAATVNVDAVGAQEVDGVTLNPGQTVMLTAQTDPRGNGHYVVESGAWSRVPYDWTKYGRVTVTGGIQNQGLYDLVASGVINSITMDSVEESMDASETVDVNTTYSGGAVYWRLVNTSWVFGVGTTSEPMTYASSSHPTANQAPFNLPYDVGTISAKYASSTAQPLKFSDYRVWDIPKSGIDLDFIRSPRYNSSKVAWNKWSILGSRGSERYTLQVLPSGYAYPSLEASNIYYDISRWTCRYDSLGNYAGPRWKRVEGLSGLPPVTAAPALGNNSNMWALGQFNPITSPGDGALEYDSWGASNTPGRVLTLANAYPASTVDAYTYYPTSPWPPEQLSGSEATEEIWVEGDDGLVYSVTVDDGPTGPTYVAKLWESKRSSAEILALNPYSSGLETVEDQSPPTTLAGDGVNALGVRIVGGVPTVYSRSWSIASDPAYIYTFGQRRQTLTLNNPAVASNPAIWSNANAAGLAIGAVTVVGSGLITLEFVGQLQPGNYRLDLQLGNYGLIDSAFTGFNIEASVDSYNTVATSTLLSSGPGLMAFSYKTSISALSSPDISASSLQAILNSMPDVAADGGVVVTGNYGGQWTITWAANGVKSSILVTTQVVGNTSVLVSAGSSTSAAVQTLAIVRQTHSIEMQVLQPTQPTWQLNLNFTNGVVLPQFNQQRAPLFYSLNIYDTVSKVWKTATTPLGLTQVYTGSYSASVGGSWKINVLPDGTVTSIHETLVEAVSNWGETDLPLRPAAGLITGSTQDKQSHLEISGTPNLRPYRQEDFTYIFEGMTPQAIQQT